MSPSPSRTGARAADPEASVGSLPSQHGKHPAVRRFAQPPQHPFTQPAPRATPTAATVQPASPSGQRGHGRDQNKSVALGPEPTVFLFKVSGSHPYNNEPTEKWTHTAVGQPLGQTGTCRPGEGVCEVGTQGGGVTEHTPPARKGLERAWPGCPATLSHLPTLSSTASKSRHVPSFTPSHTSPPRTPSPEASQGPVGSAGPAGLGSRGEQAASGRGWRNKALASSLSRQGPSLSTPPPANAAGKVSTVKIVPAGLPASSRMPSHT